MRILLTNCYLRDRSGSELYLHDVALALQRRGHEPVVFSTVLGPLADDLRSRGVRVVDDLAAVGLRPDVMHLQHTAEAAAAVLRFPGVPAVQVCHDAAYWCDEPVQLPGIVAHVVVDLAVRDRALHAGVPAASIHVIPNGVDLDRFGARCPLPAVPRRALVFSNYATEQSYLPAIRDACTKLGIECDAIGMGVGRSEQHPERVLRDYDLVFAKARCAREAIAVGCAVIACDELGLGELVTEESYSRLEGLNFGRRSLIRPVTTELVVAEIERYTAADAAKVSARMRADGGLDVMVDRLLDVYGAATRAEVDAGPHDDVLHARWAAVLQAAGARRHLIDRLQGDLERARIEAAGLARTVEELRIREAAADQRTASAAAAAAARSGREEAETALVEAETARVEAETARLAAEIAAAAAEDALRSITATRTWRARERVVPFLGWLLARRR